MGKLELAGLCLGTILVGGGLGHVRKMEVEFLARPIECHVAEWSPRRPARKSTTRRAKAPRGTRRPGYS